VVVTLHCIMQGIILYLGTQPLCNQGRELAACVWMAEGKGRDGTTQQQQALVFPALFKWELGGS